MIKRRKEKNKNMKIKKLCLLGQKVNDNRVQKANGITLIALVITIIVLLILAGVTIATLTGDNGILTKATQSKEQTEIGEEKEAIGVAYNGVKIDHEGKDVSATDLQAELRNNGYNANVTDNGDGTLTVTFSDTGRSYTIDNNGNITVGDNTGGGNTGETTVEGVTIPEGFYYVGGTKAEGIVISDNPDDANKGTSWEIAKTLKGNQFVWVPVENDEDFKTYEGYSSGELQSYLPKCEEPCTNGYASEKAEYDAMKASVLEHNGFYVGRYEAGIENETERTENSGITDDVVIKQGKNAYNYIGWSDSDDMTNETGGAVQKAKEFASENGYTSVTSTLIYGVQWDAIMAWIDPAYKTGSCAENSFVRDSTGKGSYTGSLAKTGASADYAINNIYDLAGNVYEWTMESDGTGYRVSRGSYRSTGSDGPASRRTSSRPYVDNKIFGFRLTLYL